MAFIILKVMLSKAENDPEKDIQDLLEEMETTINEIPSSDYAEKYWDEIEDLFVIWNTTREKFVALGTEMKTNDGDISGCLKTALSDVGNAIVEASEQISEALITFEGIMYEVDLKTFNIVIGSELVHTDVESALEDCKILKDSNKTNECTSGIITTYNATIHNLIEDTHELSSSLTAYLEKIENNLNTGIVAYKPYIENVILEVQGKLYSCITSM
ncbi:hypothetical protein L9F63_009107 [Diploptera punctata]|uniref:Uncharacterized protein n=1 Tax=Diploptera punctata TaxID=6984 RepID=A0AAD7Z3R3_DIPPU|nr:hypothetical protein L9F63_009107 [Diploptera punctata]